MDVNTTILREELPLFLNGATRLEVRLVFLEVLASILFGEEIQLENESGLLLDYESEQEVDVDGTIWTAGDLIVGGGRVSYVDPPRDFPRGLVRGQLRVGEDPTLHEFEGEITVDQRFRALMPADFFGGIASGGVEGRVTLENGFSYEGETFFAINDRDLYPDSPGLEFNYDNVPPSSPNEFSSGVDGEFWVNETWTPGRITMSVGFPFAETVADAGSGLDVCEIWAGFLGEAKQPFTPFDWAEIQPRLGMEYRCHDEVANVATFPLVDPVGDEQLVGIDFTLPALSEAIDPTKYISFRSVNPPPVRSFTLMDTLSGAQAFSGSLTRQVEQEDGSIERVCVVGPKREDGTCARAVIEEFIPAPQIDFDWNLSAIGDGVYFGIAEGFDAAGNGSDLILGTQWMNDTEQPTISDADAIGDTWNGGEQHSVQVSAADNLALRSARLLARYGADDLIFEYGEPGELSDPFTSGQRITSFGGREITVSNFLASVQTVPNPLDAVPGPIHQISGLTVKVHDFAPENAVTVDLVSPEFNGTNLDFNSVLHRHVIDGLSSPFVCNEPFPGACVTNPTELVIPLQSRTNGADTDAIFTGDGVFPYIRAQFPGAGGAGPARVAAPEDNWQSAEEFVTSVTVTSETIGSFTMHLYEITLVAARGMPVGEYELRVLGMDDAGHGLMSPSVFFTVRSF